MHTRIKGATLLELLLLLSIGSLMFILGLRVYQSYQGTYQIQQLQSNVDQLFNAASNYYRANCASGDFAPNPQDSLSPYPSTGLGFAYPPTSYFPISIGANLIMPGFLTNWYPANSYVDPSGGESGYVVQLNPVISSGIVVNSCVVINQGTRCVKVPASSITNSTIPSSQAVIVTWAIQVAVKVNNPSRAGGLASALGADCISGLSSSSNTVDSCSSPNSARNYIVWTRTPSYSAIIKPQILNMAMQSLRDFNKQYTHDSNYEFNNGYSLTTSPTQAPVYYLCGG